MLFHPESIPIFGTKLGGKQLGIRHKKNGD
ncbi:hypothetical protein DFP98_114146 [Cohnella phaseoli]|uniref:Uncharacterized protein n=1 Tax=Cohnella phaseoli TaxID=456490 RepID=A0A3D9JP87_9BACL|nr:hypothetical protein DFP98_114146 [Cohnella phaseoli]